VLSVEFPVMSIGYWCPTILQFGYSADILIHKQG